MTPNTPTQHEPSPGCLEKSEEVAALRTRLSAMEWRLRLVFAAGILCTTLALAAGAAAVRADSQPAALQARSLNLVDASGRTRLSLAVTPAGAPQVEFLDAQQRLRMTLGLAATGTPFVELLDPNDTVRLAMSESGGGDPLLTLVDTQKRVRLALDMGPDGSAHVRAFNSYGVRILSTP